MNALAAMASLGIRRERAFPDVVRDYGTNLGALGPACQEYGITISEGFDLLEAYGEEDADPATPGRDDLVVLRGWSGVPSDEAAMELALNAMPMERFHAAVHRLAAAGLVNAPYNGEMHIIRGVTDLGQAHIVRAALAAASPTSDEGTKP